MKKLHTEKLEKIFRDATGNDALKVSAEALKSDGTPAVVLLSEQSRRFREMSRSFGGGMDMGSMFPNEESLVLNLRNPLIKRLMELDGESAREEDVKFVARHIYDLAMLGHKPLDGQAMADFLERSNTLLIKML
jgi:molecular chaperone HtpG